LFLAQVSLALLPLLSYETEIPAGVRGLTVSTVAEVRGV
jgi:hypothetical protein